MTMKFRSELPKVADYTERKNYQSNYSKANREAINARKREWRKRRKNEKPIQTP